MTVLVQNLVTGSVAASPAFPSKDYVAGRAVIAYQSILDDADVTVSADSTASGTDPVDVADGLTHSAWSAADGNSTHYLRFSASNEGKSVDYYLVAVHNLATAACPVRLEQSDDGVTYTAVTGGGYTPYTDRPFMVLLPATAKKMFFQLAFICSGVAPSVGVVMLGQRLALQRSIHVGHKPAPLNEDIRYGNNDSVGGNFLGRSVLAIANTTDVDLKKMTPAWYRTYYKPFLQHARRKPFGFLWNKDDYPSEVIFGSRTNQPTPANEHQSFMADSLSIRGIA